MDRLKNNKNDAVFDEIWKNAKIKIKLQKIWYFFRQHPLVEKSSTATVDIYFCDFKIWFWIDEKLISESRVVHTLLHFECNELFSDIIKVSVSCDKINLNSPHWYRRAGKEVPLPVSSHTFGKEREKLLDRQPTSFIIDYFIPVYSRRLFFTSILHFLFLNLSLEKSNF